MRARRVVLLGFRVPLSQFLVVLGTNAVINRPKTDCSPPTDPNMPLPTSFANVSALFQMPLKTSQLPQPLNRLDIASEMLRPRPPPDVSFARFAFIRSVRNVDSVNA